jgi:acetoin utilization protein AcuB
MSAQALTMNEVMTPSPHSIGREQTLAMAHDLMRAEGVRHLPVLHGGKLVGLVSLRDLHLVETLPGTDPATTRVEEAMSPDVFAVSPTAGLRDVARTMADRKLGSVVVMRRAQVIGIFTTVDALRTLASLLP